jgi:hypothetical protein
MATNAQRMFATVKGLAEQLVAAMARFPSGTDDETWVFQASLHFFFCKAYKTYQALERLCLDGFVEDAEVLSRTLFELWLQSQWISTSPNKMARLFAEHAAVRRYSHYLRMKKVKDSPKIAAVVAVLESKPGLAELEKEYERLKANYLKSGRGSASRVQNVADNWWGNSIYWLAKNLGPLALEQYATVYWCQSDLVHTGSTSVRDYLKRSKEGWLANCYPASDDVSEGLTALWASLWFLGIIEILCRAWDLGLEGEIRRVGEEVDELGQAAIAATSTTPSDTPDEA